MDIGWLEKTESREVVVRGVLEVGGIYIANSM